MKVFGDIWQAAKEQILRSKESDRTHVLEDGDFIGPHIVFLKYFPFCDVARRIWSHCR